MGALELDRLTWPEVRSEQDTGRDTVVVAFGATEQHGPHMPLATDALLGDHMAHAVAERLGGLRGSRQLRSHRVWRRGRQFVGQRGEPPRSVFRGPQPGCCRRRKILVANGRPLLDKSVCGRLQPATLGRATEVKYEVQAAVRPSCSVPFCFHSQRQRTRYCRARWHSLAMHAERTQSLFRHCRCR